MVVVLRWLRWVVSLLLMCSFLLFLACLSLSLSGVVIVAASRLKRGGEGEMGETDGEEEEEGERDKEAETEINTQR